MSTGLKLVVFGEFVPREIPHRGRDEFGNRTGDILLKPDHESSRRHKHSHATQRSNRRLNRQPCWSALVSYGIPLPFSEMTALRSRSRHSAHGIAITSGGPLWTPCCRTIINRKAFKPLARFSTWPGQRALTSAVYSDFWASVLVSSGRPE
jgi:hypothetical protein